MTIRHRLELALLDDIVVSRRNATAGGHETLHHIPGTALRGWAAAQLHSTLAPHDAWTVFHSGFVRFGNALPMDESGEPAAPMPLALHRDKATPPDPAVGAEMSAFNLAVPGWDAGGAPAQPRQIRVGYVTARGSVVEVRTRERMMTAIGEAGQVATGQLFAYQSIERGQRFVAEIAIDDAVPPALAQRLLATLEGTLRLGRSRATGYGRVRACLGTTPPAAAVGQADGDRLCLWLLSDACVRGANGVPSLAPPGDDIGLPGARLDAEFSFVRSRSFSAWNAHRNGPELEQQSIVAGSVLTYHRAAGFTQAELQRLADAGIGDARAGGCGAVAVQPGLLRSAKVALRASRSSLEAGAFSLPGTNATSSALHVQSGGRNGSQVPVSTPLLDALRHRAEIAGARTSAERWLDQTLEAIGSFHLQARAFSAVADDAELGPGPTQWGRLGAVARQAGSPRELFDMLERDVLRSGNARWDARQLRVRDPATGERSLRDVMLDAARALRDEVGLDDAQALDAWERMASSARRAQFHIKRAIAPSAAGRPKENTR